jgi:exodeoxyribonuclease VII small subunit
MSKTKVLPKNLSFEKALERLQEILAEMEDPEKGLETSLALFEEGVSLSRFCRSRIAEIQKRVDVVLKETPEGLSTSPLDEELDDDSGDSDDDEEDATR